MIDKILTPAEKKKPKITRKEKQKFAKVFIETGNNATKAYQAIRPLVQDDTARTRGKQLTRDILVRAELSNILSKNGITTDYLIKGYKVALEAGLARRATNRDALTALSELSKLAGIQEKTDSDPLERDYLETLSREALITRLDQISKQVKELKREGAIDGHIEPITE